MAWGQYDPSWLVGLYEQSLLYGVSGACDYIEIANKWTKTRVP